MTHEATELRNSFRILLISDLHISPHQKISNSVDSKQTISNLSDAVQDRTSIFINRLKKLFKDDPAELPVAVIVSGDLVNMGGNAESDDGVNEFDSARAFLQEIAKALNINDENIIVVPGNHDVDWTYTDPETQQWQRFEKYVKAVKGFHSPHFINNELVPIKVSLPTQINQSYRVNLLLLVSPTYSGTANDENKRHMREYLERLNLDEDMKNDLLKHIENQKDRLDIAAIGSNQRNIIGEDVRDDDNIIHIAVMHHHLLPDPQLEITNFEAVIDSGRVIDELIESKFDLVLTGHKHNRKFMNISKQDSSKNLDVYSSPSLFNQGSHCTPGFSVIEINSPLSPYYATIKSYNTFNNDRPSVINLERKNKVFPGLKESCVQLPFEVQVKHLKPITDNIRLAFEWEGGNFKNLFDDVFDSIKNDINLLSERTLVFRSPYIGRRWAELIKLAESSDDQTLKFVNDGDIQVFLDSIDEQPYAIEYSRPIIEFKGRKERAFIINQYDKNSKEKLKDFNTIISNMINNQQFDNICVVWKDNLPDEYIRNDFAIIGGFAVGTFQGGNKTASISLKQRFSHEKIDKAQNDWKVICGQAVWNSNTNVLFSEFVKQNLGLEIEE